MESIYFKNKTGENLNDLLMKGIIAYAVIRGKSVRPDIIFLKLKNQSILKIKSVLIEMDGWNEIGTLEFSLERELQDLYPLNEAWARIKSVTVLALIESKITCQSGLKLKNIEGESIYIVPSALPYSIELKADFYDGDFEPECALGDYSVVRFA